MKKFKLIALIICMLAAGICYSVSRGVFRESQGQNGETSEYMEQTLLADGTDLDEINQSGMDRAEMKLSEVSSEDGQGNVEGTERAASQTEAAQAETVQAEAVQPETTPLLCVHICGQVKKPGVYSLTVGSRLYEAVEMAGGFTEEAAEDWLNLAMVLADGMKVEVPDRETVRKLLEVSAETGQSRGWITSETELDPGSETPQSAAAEQKKISINTASKEELMQLSGIGASRAEDIIRYREEHGRFTCIEDIMKVSGIKEGAFEKIKDAITL